VVSRLPRIAEVVHVERIEFMACDDLAVTVVDVPVDPQVAAGVGVAAVIESSTTVMLGMASV
jgi:hypothetical protein